MEVAFQLYSFHWVDATLLAEQRRKTVRCYEGSTTLVELTMLTSIVRSIVVRCRQRACNSCYSVLEQEPTIVGETRLLMVVNND